jgi:hypothetical protein
MTAAIMWKKMDLSEGLPCHILLSDNCFYARDYVSHGGYGASEANDLISNFKIPVSYRGQGRWHYKEKAIRRFAQELSTLIGPADADGKNFVAAIPSSKRTDSPEYDPRLELTLQQLSRLRQDVQVVEPIIRTTSVEPAHQRDSRPKISEICASLQWNGLPEGVNSIIFIDDVITTGASFKACQRIATENVPGIEVCGVFWAKTVWLP